MLQANKGKGVKSVCTDEWQDKGGLLTFRGRIYMPNIPELWQQIVEQHHDSCIAGHPGRWSWFHAITGGPRCHGTWAPTLAPAISVYRQSPATNSLWVSSTPSQSLLSGGA